MTDILNPCPFCGQTDKLVFDTLGDIDAWFVECDRCDISLHANRFREATIEAWNRRAESRAEGRGELRTGGAELQSFKMKAEAKESAAGEAERQLAALKAEHLALINAFSPRNATLKLLHSLAKDLGACNDGDGHFLIIAADIVEKWIKPPELPPLPPPPGAEARPHINDRIKAAMANQACTDDLARTNRSPEDCPVGCPIHGKETDRCDCFSGNNPGGKRQPFMVERDGKTFSVDACIVPAVQALWAAGIKTGNSCCGHGHFAPWVALMPGEEVYRASEVIRAVDPRLFAFNIMPEPERPREEEAEQVERVAFALHTVGISKEVKQTTRQLWNTMAGEMREHYRKMASAAIAALRGGEEGRS